VRESPAIEIVHLLREDGYRVEHYDPLVRGMGYDSLVEVAREADCLAILVEHDEVMRELEAARAKIEGVMSTPLILCF
jgi:UDP-N-acetyl-D-mannosaminuronate dehydrogenase